MPEVHPLLARLVEERKAKRMTQTEIAKQIGVSKTAICEMEKGSHEPKMRTFIGYAEALGHKVLDDDSGSSPVWEYTADACDVWELHHLCNHYAGNGGWEPVFAVESHPGVKLPERVGDDNSPQRNYAALKPYEVLFRRVVKDEEDEP